MNRNLITMNLDKNTELSVKRVGKEIVACFGEDMIFMSEEQAENLLAYLDAQIHDKTETREYMVERILELEDFNFDMQSDLDEANDLVNSLEEALQEAM
jgi:enhancing lycopene biosynthesis protein 2